MNNPLSNIQKLPIGQFMSDDEVLSHVTNGILCGYPECCIKFCLLRRRDCIVPVNPYSDFGVILCPKCAEKTDIDVIIQANRLLDSQFPHHPKYLIGCGIPDDARRRAESVAKELITLFKVGTLGFFADSP